MDRKASFSVSIPEVQLVLMDLMIAQSGKELLAIRYCHTRDISMKPSYTPQQLLRLRASFRACELLTSQRSYRILRASELHASLGPYRIRARLLLLRHRDRAFLLLPTSVSTWIPLNLPIVANNQTKTRIWTKTKMFLLLKQKEITFVLNR